MTRNIERVCPTRWCNVYDAVFFSPANVPERHNDEPLPHRRRYAASRLDTAILSPRINGRRRHHVLAISTERSVFRLAPHDM